MRMGGVHSLGGTIQAVTIMQCSVVSKIRRSSSEESG
jgi:hypothetical protein